MKKFLLLLFGLTLVFGFAGCNTDGSEIVIDEDAFIASPVNLQITGTTLSWDAVENADGYIVYANDEEVDTVQTTSFNFSSIVEDRIIFQVRTKAPRGMQDSPLSASIAYVADPEAEADLILESMADMGLDVPAEFADELVRKGMLGTEAESLATAVQTFVEDMDASEDMSDAFAALNALLAEVDNIEAIVSAIVKVLMPQMLQERIQNMQEERDMYQGWIDEEPWNEYYYSGEVERLNNQIMMFQSLLDEIEADPDAIVLAVKQTIDYFISIEEMIDQNLIDMIQSLSETQDIKDLNVTELVQVKEEVVNILRDTMPTQEEIMLMFQVYGILMSLSGEYVQIEYSVEDYETKMAIQSLYMIELFVNFVDTLDTNYFETVIDEIEFEESEYGGSYLAPMAGAEIGILTIEYFAQFKQDNQNLLDTLSAVFTDEEKEALFNDYIDSIPVDGENITQAMITGLHNLDFQQILYLDTMFGDLFDTFLNTFVETDGEIIRIAITMSGFEWDYSSDTYVNRVTGEEYSSWDDMNYAENLLRFQLMNQVSIFAKALIDDANNEDYYTLTSFFANVAEVMVQVIPDGDFSPVVTAFQAVIENSSADQKELLTNLFDYLAEEEVFIQLYDLKVAIHDYLVDEYGAEYWDNSAYLDDDFEQFATIILMAQLYDGFMTSGNRSLVDGILDEVFAAMMADEIENMLGLTDTDIQNLAINIDDFLDLVGNNFDDIKGYNPNSLDAADKEDIMALIEEIQYAAEDIMA